MTTFVLATANQHKALEMRAVLSPLGIDLESRPTDVGEIEETGVTLEENALLKARALVEATHRAAIADDTGLFVDALDGRPGVRSARYAGDAASYDDNVAKLLSELVGVENRSARFVTVIAVAYPDGTAFCVEGELEGSIVKARAGDQGFGYDPVFMPDDGGGRTLAELTPQQKNETSHRARALRKLVEELTQG